LFHLLLTARIGTTGYTERKKYRRVYGNLYWRWGGGRVGANKDDSKKAWASSDIV
jgi:transposase